MHAQLGAERSRTTARGVLDAFETALTTKTPDLSEASISSDFLIAGAGFEPATFGL